MLSHADGFLPLSALKLVFSKISGSGRKLISGAGLSLSSRSSEADRLPARIAGIPLLIPVMMDIAVTADLDIQICR